MSWRLQTSCAEFVKTLTFADVEMEQAGDVGVVEMLEEGQKRDVLLGALVGCEGAAGF